MVNGNTDSTTRSVLPYWLIHPSLIFIASTAYRWFSRKKLFNFLDMCVLCIKMDYGSVRLELLIDTCRYLSHQNSQPNFSLFQPLLILYTQDTMVHKKKSIMQYCSLLIPSRLCSSRKGPCSFQQMLKD